MSRMGNFMTALRSGYTAFRESYLDADTLDLTAADTWGQPEARQLRYEMFNAYFQGNAYRAVHNWSKKMKADFGLYKYTRDIYNPAFRLGSFYRTYVWGGRLDMRAGDGKETPSALPIKTDNEDLRPAIAQLWQDSNWKTRRKLVPLRGSVMGDVILQVMDDPFRGKVYLKVTHPGHVAWLEKDDFGNVKSYVIQRKQKDPANGRTAVYTETVYRDGDLVVYELEKDGRPYDWGNVDAEGNPITSWSVPYGFVPMVHIKHVDVGLEWGMSELQPRLSLFREIDDQGSKINDQIRKIVAAPALFAGVKKPGSTPTTSGAAASSTRPEPGREEVPAIYSTDPAAKVHFLVAPLDITAVAQKIKDDLELLEKDYPELALIRAMNSEQGLSGIALERLQTQAGEKVQDYRDTYDDALVRIQQMAVSIGGWRGYDGFDGFDLNSYERGDLAHEIDLRPVFTPTTSQQLEYNKIKAETERAQVAAGWPLIEALRAQGVDQDTIAKIEASPEYLARLAMIQLGLDSAGGGNG